MADGPHATCFCHPGTSGHHHAEVAAVLEAAGDRGLAVWRDVWRLAHDHVPDAAQGPVGGEHPGP